MNVIRNARFINWNLKMAKVFKTFVIWRLFLFVPVFLAGYFIIFRTGYLSINPWANFDGVHYLSIAANGYVNQAVFFPLYPLLIKIFSFRNQMFLSGFLISNISFFVSLYFFYKLLRLDYKEKTSWDVLVILLLFPTALFFGAVYSESLFFLLLILSLYFARRGMWFWASVAGMLLSATRLIGIFILPALAYEQYVQKKKFNLWLLITPICLFAYSLFNFKKWGDWFYFINAHSELGNGRVTNGIVLFPQTVYRYFKIFLSLPVSQYEWWIAALELTSFIGVSLLLYFAWKKKVRTSYLIFSILAFLLPVSSGTFSGLPRYIIVLFPIFIALSFLGERVKKIWLFISGILLFILTMFFVRGYFVA